MTDNDAFARLSARAREFALERGWDDVRTLKDLSMAVSIEAAELQELFLWAPTSEEERILREKREDIVSELADIFLYLLAFADRTETDLIQAAESKVTLNESRFPGA